MLKSLLNLALAFATFVAFQHAFTMHAELDFLKEKFINQDPEIVFEWNDPLSDARGWVVINSLRNGAAGGGTRMRIGLSRDEVLALAKVMEVKFTVSGPDIGGAKSGINFDPSHPDKEAVLHRWYKAVFPLLKNYYGTGGDLNVDEIKEVIPITEDFGLWHPQEGVVNGHYGEEKSQRIHRLGQLRFGCSKIVEDDRFAPREGKKYAVADMITGYGVSESVKHYYNLFKNEDLTGKRLIMQGWGNVASAAALYLADLGVKIVGIIDRDGGLINRDGMPYTQVRNLFLNKIGNKLFAHDLRSYEEVNEEIWDVHADIFIPGAASRLVERAHVDRLIAGGVNCISCGANVPFVDDKIFYGPTAAYADSKLGLIPDFIANCGMARTFAYLMQNEIEITDEGIFHDVSQTIMNALKEIHQEDPTGIRISEHGLLKALKLLA